MAIFFSDDIKIVFLGGLGEIGRNCTAFDINGKIIVVDSGVMFPNVDMLGIDIVLPDFTYLFENADRIEAAIFTHGHEDHIGALSFLLKKAEFPIHGSELTLGFIKNRLTESSLVDRTSFNVVRDGESVQFTSVNIEFIPVSHSVPQAFAFVLYTKQGAILHTGDFKIDDSPIDGRVTDLNRIREISNVYGIKLLLSDSTNAEELGTSDSEGSVRGSIYQVFQQNSGKRIIVACFASHIHRIKQIIDCAVSSNKVVALLGRSMIKNVQVAKDIGLLDFQEDVFIPIEDLNKYDNERVCIISTGSQGEPMSALSLMASGRNRWLNVNESDVVILSSRTIQGNETSVGKVIDMLCRKGVDVVHSGIAHVHVSGHACREELHTMISSAKPEYFIPIHGEYRQRINHARLALSAGVDKDKILVCDNGDVVSLSDNICEVVDKIPNDYIFVDGNASESGNEVINDRYLLAREGFVSVIVVLDKKHKCFISEPVVSTMGWAYDFESELLIKEAKETILLMLKGLDNDALENTNEVKRRMRKTLGAFVDKRTKRRPVIIPVLIEVS